MTDSTADLFDAQSLITKAKRGDFVAFGQLIAKLEPQLRNEISIPGQFQSDFGVEDVLQEAYIDALQNLGQFEGSDLATLYAWLRTTIANAHRQYVRALTAVKRGGDFTRIHDTDQASGDSAPFVDKLIHSSTTPGRIVVAKETAARLEHDVAQLPAIYQDVIRARFIEGRAIKEIAALFGISEGAALMRLVRALAVLRGAR